MKKQLITLSALILTGAITFTACKKTTTPTPAPATTTTGGSSSPSTATPATPSDANGVLVALKLHTGTTTNIPGYGPYTTFINIDGGIGLFPTAAGGSTYQDAGTVTINTTNLDKQTDNQYNKIQQVNQANFNISNQVKWTVTGNTNVPAVTNFTSTTPPVYDTTYFAGLLTSNTITRANGLSFNINSYVSNKVNGDSVICVLVGGGSTKLVKTVSAYASSMSFTASELAALSTTTTGQFQVTPYHQTNQTFSGKKYYFISEQAYVKTGVTIN
ncbi:MAG: hypothetical protein ABI388_06545 [Bacteroidia bacterium]